MKIVILSRSKNLYSTLRLSEVGEDRGHEMIVADPLRCYMDITSSSQKVFFKSMELSEVDAVIPRIGASITFYGTAVLRQFEMGGSFPLNESVAITRSRDKLRSLQLLARKGIGMPATSFAHSTKMTGQLIDLVGGAPLIIKLIESTQGSGVVLAETTEAAESVIDAFRNLDANFLVQEFIEEARGTDLRCFVIGEKVVASIKRVAKKGEFRANIHKGGSAEIVKVTPEERALAVKATRIMGLNVAGVDIVRSRRGPLVLEINSTPGLRGIEEGSQKDVAGLIVQYLEKYAKKGRTKTRGKG